jgi:hypothetical protein
VRTELAPGPAYHLLSGTASRPTLTSGPMNAGSDHVTVRGVPVLIEVFLETEERWSWRFTADNGVNGCNGPGDLATSEIEAFDRALDAAYRAVSDSAW